MARRLIAKTLILVFVLSSMPVQAGMIGTPDTLAQAQSQEQRASLNALLQRTDVSEKLLAAGVQPSEIQARIDALSDQEVATLAAHFEQLPAGGDAVTILGVIVVVLIITDLMGYTDVFSFIKK